MEIHNQIFYTTLCSCVLSFTGETLTYCCNLYCKSYIFLCQSYSFTYHFINLFFFWVGLILQGHLLLAVDFVSRHRDCLLDIALLSTVSFSFPLFFYLVITITCCVLNKSYVYVVSEVQIQNMVL